jgi:hypothetical protein
VEIYRNGRTVTLSVTPDEKPHEETQPQQPRQDLPQTNPDNQFQDWYDIFKDYFG